MTSNSPTTMSPDGKHPADSEKTGSDAGKEARKANEAMNKAKSDDTTGRDSLIPGLRQSDTGGSSD